MAGAWAWGSADAGHLDDARSKLAGFEASTWAQLRGDHHHRVVVADLEPEAQKRLRELRQDDVDALYSLRLTGKRRVWGILHTNVFYLLWWDPTHSVCKSNLKYT